MAAENYGRRFNPYRRLREPLGIKGERQTVVVTHNPSTIGQNERLVVRFPKLGQHDVVVLGTARLAFTITLKSPDANRTVVQNLGRAIVREMIKMNGEGIMSIDDSDVQYCYLDLWKTRGERENAQYQGIDLSDEKNVTKLRIGADDGSAEEVGDSAIAKAYVNRFYIPLDFELLESQMPFYPSALSDHLEYELSFNDHSRVIQASGEALDLKTTTYRIDNICLEFEKVTQPDLARIIRGQYAGNCAVLFDRILRHRILHRNKNDSMWNININSPALSIKGVLLLFEEPRAAFKRDTEAFYNPEIQKIEVTIEGAPNQLYSQGMRPYQHWDEAKKFFAAGNKRHPEEGMVAKDLAMADVSLEEFLTTKYALWLDLRTSDDDQLHGSGRRVINNSEGITLQLTKAVQKAGPLNIYLYIIMDAQLNISDGRFKEMLKMLGRLRRPTRQSSADRLAVEKPCSLWICLKGLIVAFSSISSYYAPLYGTTRLTSSAPGSGRTLRLTSWTPASAFTIGCGAYTSFSRARQRCISSTTARLRKR